MCLFDLDVGDVQPGDKGHAKRQVRPNLESRLSRMQTASAIVSMGREARVSMACTRVMEAEAREAEAGMRLTR